MIVSSFSSEANFIAGCDEAGRGCLAGPVFAAAVIFPSGYSHPLINDSKKLSQLQRESLLHEVERDALAVGIGVCTSEEIDKINILHASIEAMHRALSALKVAPELILVDGNRFSPYKDIPYHCIVKGDSKEVSIAAASIVAKVKRDNFMAMIAEEYPCYGWEKNKGYPTKLHSEAIEIFGTSPYHRRSFKHSRQLKFDFQD